MQSDFFSKTILADVETGSKESNAGVQVSYGGGCGPWQNRGHQEQSQDGLSSKGKPGKRRHKPGVQCRDVHFGVIGTEVGING